ncbi:unnamed protein product [Gongylonema pulchrum]|uniref:ER membrane protein complex subunit 1 n=1 Tax=Gongylonema pulchrum TaxID=637853 RepID=A0A183DYN7_9BILA|nr:unnamed protein product [Gongylonema pulchrum]
MYAAATLQLAALVACASAIYEDQIGKFDWRQENVGCPRQIHVERAKGLRHTHVLVSTEADMVASLQASTGQIVWKQQLEHSSSSSSPLTFTAASKSLITFTNNNDVVRAWDRETGILLWETQISQIANRDAHVTALSLANGQYKWSRNEENIKDWIGSMPGSQMLTSVGGVAGVELSVVRIDITNGATAKLQKLNASWFKKEKCTLSDTLLSCFDETGFHVADLSSDPVTVHHTALPAVHSIMKLNTRDLLLVNSHTNTYVYRLTLSEPPTLMLELEKVEAVATSDRHDFLAVATAAHELIVYDAVKGELLFRAQILEKDLAPFKMISFIGSGQEFEFAVVLEDCRLIYLVGSSNKLAKEWIRHEALSTVTSVEMVDLPLSEAQADIESEFATDGGNFQFFFG